MDETLVNLKRPYSPEEIPDDEEVQGFFSFPDYSLERRYDIDKSETKRVKNCHRERCRVQKLNSSLHHLNMLLPQTQRSPGNGKHFSKVIPTILLSLSWFIFIFLGNNSGNVQ